MEARITVLKTILFFVVLVAAVTISKSQSGYFQDTIRAQDSFIFISPPSLHPSLLQIRRITGEQLKDSTDFFHLNDSVLILRSNQDYDKPYIVRHQMLSSKLLRPYTWIDTQLVKSDYLIKSIPTGLQSESSFPAWSDISYSGHFGRGLTIGNAQNATLQSNFDLQLKGRLPHGIEVTGTLSDNSIPIQPEGNSLRLQEFDKVFIRLRKNKAMLVAGDHEIRNPENYFIQYYKKTKGVFGQLETDLPSGWNQKTSLNYSISKGKFKRTEIDAEEGNQGPYRMSQTSNNLFVIILAGTEKVYLDGNLLQRGELNDYTIDYNLGEITFTPHIYISATSRIIVEYEYAEQNYLRSLFAGHTDWKKNNWKMGLMIYSEQDGKSAFQNNLLTPENESIMAEAGGDVENLQGSSVIPWKEGYEEGVILYQKIDTMGNADVLQLVKKPVNAPLYTASFQYVGEGKGDYLPAGEYTNGEVFYWVAPDSRGNPTGSYAPITPLQTPRAQQMFGFSIEKDWGQNRRVFSEWSLSHDDINRFSSSSASRNAGWAQRSGFVWRTDIDTLKNQFFQLSGSWERKNVNFNPISPYRAVEFQRDWNFDPDHSEKTEQLYQISARYESEKMKGNYSFRRFDVQKTYKGNQHEVNIKWSPGKWKMSFNESFLSSRSTRETSIFSRPSLEVGSFLGTENSWEWKAGYEGEYNPVRNIQTDSLTAASIRYDRVFTRLKWLENGHLTLSRRNDYSLNQNSFISGFQSHDIQFSSRLQNEQSNLQWIGTLRHVEIRSEEVKIDKTQKGWNLLSQLLFSSRWFKEGWTNQGEISLANGKEPQRQFQYIRVETGKGQYKHVDLNGDSIQQLNEFFPAIYPDERKYIRVSTLENTLISTFNYNIKWALNIRMAQWTDHPFWSKWSSENSFRIDKRQLREGKIHLWEIPDSTLISSKEDLLSNLYFNQNGQKFQQHVGFWMRNQKDFLQSGFENNRNKEIFSKSTVLYTSSLHSLWEIKQKLLHQTAENFHEKNFQIRFWDFSHKLRWIIQSSMQFEYKIAFISGTETSEKANSSSWTHQLNGQYRPDLNWSFQGSVDFVRIRFDQPEINLALEQVMLEGLQSGQNFLWEANVQRRLPNDLVISLQYSGRKSGHRDIIHQGSVQANLLF